MFFHSVMRLPLSDAFPLNDAVAVPRQRATDFCVPVSSSGLTRLVNFLHRGTAGLLALSLGSCGHSQHARGEPPQGGVGTTFLPSGKALSAPPETQVRLSLLSSVTRLDAEPFWLMVHLKAPAGTHLYWRHPGESGLATEARFEAEPGFEIAEVRYPGPVSFRSERGAISYGYLERAALLAEVTPTSQLDHARFTVQASWLSCGAVCVQETGQASLELEADHSPETASAASAEFEPWLARLPLEQVATQAEWVTARQLELTPAGTDTLLEYFPLEPLAAEDRAPLSEPLPGGKLRITMRRQEPLAVHRGVLRFARGSLTLYAQVEFPGR